MIHLQLLWSFMQIGLFSIGGGLAAMPMIQSQVVDTYHWLTIQEFADILTISEMTPGPIAINCATFVGTRVAGFGGAIVATLGCVLPSCIIVITLAYFYNKYRDLTAIQGVLGGLRPAVVAMIASAGVGILILALFGTGLRELNIQNFSPISAIVFVTGLFVLRRFKPNPIWVMFGSGILGMCVFPFIG